MISENIASALEFIVNSIRGRKLNWVIGGSCSLAFNGLDVKPKDIDLITDKPGAYIFGEVLSKHLIKPVDFREGERFSSHFGRFLVKNMKVEVSGNLKIRNDKGEWTNHFLDHYREITFRGVKIKVLSIEKAFISYLILGRERTLNQIASFLREKGYDHELLSEVIKEGFLLPSSVERVLKLVSA